jgi:Potassium-transporting ATPase A subunit
MVLAPLLAASALAAMLAFQTASQRAGLRDIGDRDAPEVVATSDFYFALNDMDAQVANILLIGDETDLGFTAAQAQAIFNQRRAQADTDLQKAAVAATDPATATTIRTVLDAYGAQRGVLPPAVLGIVVAADVPLGDYMARVYTSDRHWRIERVFYRACGVDPDAEQRWSTYLKSLLAFSAAGVLGFYALDYILILALGPLAEGLR